MVQRQVIKNNKVGIENILKTLRKREIHYKYKRGQPLIPLNPLLAGNLKYTQRRNHLLRHLLIKQELDSYLY